MKKKILFTALRTVRRLQDPYYQGAAAEMGFYFIFSIIPILTIMLQILSLFDIAGQLFEQILLRFSENDLAVSLINSVQNALSSKISLAFIVVALWSASKIEFSMIRMANYTYKLDNSKVTGYVRNRLRAVFTVSALILMIIASLLILVYGNMLVLLLNSLLSEFLHIKFEATWLFSILRWPVAFAAYCFVIAVNYTIIPNRRLSIKHTIPGSVFAAIGIIVTTLAYYVYFQNFSNFNLIYGSLAAIIALLLWFYFLSYILILGMIINVVWFEDDR